MRLAEARARGSREGAPAPRVENNMKIANVVAAAGVLAAASAASAQLGGLGWTFTMPPGSSGSFSDNGSVLTLVGDDSGLFGSESLYSTVLPSGGTLSFDWQYISSDSGCFDTGGYYLNGSLTTLACNSGTPTSGHVDLAVNGSDSFAFVVYSADGIFGPGTLVITNFSAPGGCYADCEGDDDLDVFDYLCFLGEYANQSAYADCEGDGDWDVFDYLCFLGAYANGCN